MPNERMVRQALLTKPTGKRPRCRLRPRRSSCISDLAWSGLGVEPAELSEIEISFETIVLRKHQASQMPSSKEPHLAGEPQVPEP